MIKNSISNFFLLFLLTFSLSIFSMNNIGNDNLEEALFYAIKQGCLAEVKYFIEEKGVDANSINSHGLKLIDIATYEGQLEIVKYLVEEKGVDANSINSYGSRPIEYATKFGQLEIVIYFIEERGIEASSALFDIAAKHGQLEIVKYLVEKTAIDVNSTDDSGLSWIDLPIRHGQLEIVKYLVEEKGIDIDVTNNHGLRPIDIAAYCGQLEIVKYFVKKRGANINLINNRNLNPIDIAKKRNHTEIANYLTLVSNFDKAFKQAPDKYKFLFDITTKAIEEEKKDNVMLFISLALNREKDIFGDFNDNRTTLKKFCDYISIFWKATPSKKYENVKTYCKTCSELFNMGKNNKIIRKAVLDALGEKEQKNRDHFYSLLRKKFLEDKQYAYTSVSKVMTVLGKYQINKNLGKQLNRRPRIAPDITIVFK